MSFAPAEKMQIKNSIERVLHVPGNYSGGALEMAMVFDCNLPEEYIKRTGKEMAALLKSHSEIFKNVRLNTICWEEDEVFIKEVGSIPYLQMGRCFDRYRCAKNAKRLEILAYQLKKFYARSKIIMLFTDGNHRVEDRICLKENMYPFLHRKLIVLCCETDDEGQTGKISAYSGTELMNRLADG